MTQEPIRNVLTQDVDGSWFTICPNCNTKHDLSSVDMFKPDLQCCTFKWQNFGPTGELDPGWIPITTIHVTKGIVKAAC